VAPAESLIRKADLNFLGELKVSSPGENLDARKAAVHTSRDKHDENLCRRKSPLPRPYLFRFMRLIKTK
jgi:hypothetical protein